MGRLACIDLPAFPLQLLLRREPTWADQPVAVVEEDKPQARIEWLNEKARECGILPGMRYATGLALSSRLCAAPVPPAARDKGVAFVTERLRLFSPGVEPSPAEPGVFWTLASGLERLFPSRAAWAEDIRADLSGHGFFCRVVVGQMRFSTYAIARSRRGPRVIVLKTKAEENRLARRVPLDRLDLDPAVRDALFALGVESVGDLLRLPAAGVRARFGDEVHRLFRWARGETQLPLQPEPEKEPVRQLLYLDDPETNHNRLLFLVKRMLHPLLEKLARKRHALTELVLAMKLDRGGEREERLRPADPTLDAQQLLDLTLLRLEAARLSSGVIELALDAESAPATREQLELFADRPRRDPAAARRALARLRAEFGSLAVVRAELRPGHLPEAGFRWTPLRKFPAAAPERVLFRPLVRRIYHRPVPLPHRRRHEEDGWQMRGHGDPAVDAMLGPFVVSGGWWRVEVAREYHFARNRKGDWLWVFRDRNRRRWFLHGRVE